MELRRFARAQDFLEAAQRFLLNREASHHLMLGLALNLVQNPGHYPEGAYLAVVLDGDGVAMAALRTLPQNLLLSEAR